jgi:hypothetical protein
MNFVAIPACTSGVDANPITPGPVGSVQVNTAASFDEEPCWQPNRHLECSTTVLLGY